ncbi:PIN domain-containing protein [Nostocales cyanobacterium LEGE 11386]|nr:PIN domain-containing protein [Nostocales cyanobacterium LEGE 11386]
MSYLVDTNVLLRSVDLSHPMNFDAANAISTLHSRGEQLHIVPQNLIESWSVYTRPIERNGLGRSVAEAQAEVNRLKVLFPMLLDTEAIYQEWERLVVVYGIRGINVHDARLVAAMLVHGLTHILTFNVSDFARYSEITTINPGTI